MVLATLLVNRSRVFGDVEGAIAQTFFHVDENVGQLAVIGHDGLGHIAALAGRVLAHVNFLPLSGGAGKGHSATHAGRGRGINWRRGWRRFYFRARRSALLFIGVFLLATARQYSQQAEHAHCRPYFLIHYVALSSDVSLRTSLVVGLWSLAKINVCGERPTTNDQGRSSKAQHSTANHRCLPPRSDRQPVSAYSVAALKPGCVPWRPLPAAVPRPSAGICNPPAACSGLSHSPGTKAESDRRTPSGCFPV